jgi:hypothetical protein
MAAQCSKGRAWSRTWGTSQTPAAAHFDTCSVLRVAVVVGAVVVVGSFSVLVAGCGKGGGSTPRDASGSAGVGGSGAGGAAGDGGVPDHTIVTWPPFPAGNCAPTRPAVLEGPGVVDPEDLCVRRGGDEAMTPILIGEWGYGSIGILNNSSPDAAFPDYDTFVLRPVPAEGDIMRVTVETLDGADFQPYALLHFNAGSVSQWMSPMPDNTGVARRELLSVGAFELQITVSDYRAHDAAAYAAGARAIYRVRVDPVPAKTPVVLAPLPQVVTGDFTREGLVGVYEFTVPAEQGRMLINVGTETRYTTAPTSPMDTLTILWDPVAGKVVKEDFYNSIRGTSIALEVNPADTSSLVLKPGRYWLFVDTGEMGPTTAAAARTDYDVSVEFKGRPANDVCAGAIDVTPGATPRVTMGETTYAVNDHSLGRTEGSWSCLPGLLTGLPLVGRDLVYVATVPAGQKLTAKLTPSPATGWNAALWLSDRCTVGASYDCLAVTNASETGVETLTWANPGTAAAQIFVHVDSLSTPGTFTLETSLADVGARPANDLCTTATALSIPATGGSQTVTGTTESAADDEHAELAPFAPACQDTAAYWAGPDVVYSLTVPVGGRVRATLTPTGAQTWNPALWLSEACGDAAAPASCVAAQDNEHSSEMLTWLNRSSAAKMLYLHVDARRPLGGPFSMSVVVDVPASVCPTTPRDPAVAFVGSTTSAYNEYTFSPMNVTAAACRSGVTSAWIGGDAVYLFMVPAGRTLSVQVKSTVTVNGVGDAWKSMLSTACGDVVSAGAACLGVGSDPGSVTWTNGGATEQAVYLYVDRASGVPANASYNVIPTLN